MQQLKQHLIQLGLNAELILQQMPENLTLSYEDGVLFICDKQHIETCVHVDFMSGPMAFRAAQHVGGEHLVKACKIKSQASTHILDATCGMGKDSFLLFKSGFEVTATEQNVLVHALLSNGLSRYLQQTQSLPFELHLQAAESLMQQRSFDVIYLDPMFPHKAKSAKAKKDMQLFQLIHHQAEDNAEQLLNQALQASCQRVVIKRPVKAPAITAKPPTFQIMGKTCRFDAFQVN